MSDEHDAAMKDARLRRWWSKKMDEMLPGAKWAKIVNPTTDFNDMYLNIKLPLNGRWNSIFGTIEVYQVEISVADGNIEYLGIDIDPVDWPDITGKWLPDEDFSTELRTALLDYGFPSQVVASIPDEIFYVKADVIGTHPITESMTLYLNRSYAKLREARKGYVDIQRRG